jgi:hypothetical protein
MSTLLISVSESERFIGKFKKRKCLGGLDPGVCVRGFLQFGWPCYRYRLNRSPIPMGHSPECREVSVTMVYTQIYCQLKYTPNQRLA